MADSPLTTEQLLAQNRHVHALAQVLATADATADDLEQEAWTAALRPGVERPTRNPRAWWTTLVRRTASNLHRAAERRRQREAVATEVATRDAEAAPFDLAIFEERRADLVAEVDALPAAQRDVILARYWRGLEPSAIAAENGESPAAVRQRLARAHKTLRTRLDRHEPGGRAAWLLPLLGGKLPSKAVVGTGFTMGIGALMVKNYVVTAAAVVLLASGAWTLWLQEAAPITPPPAEEAATVTNGGVASRQDSTTARETAITVISDTESKAVRSELPRLRQRDGSPLANVPYWIGGEPRPRDAIAPPSDARHTDDEGRLSRLEQRDGWLWFRPLPHAAFALPLMDWDRRDVLVPRWREVRATIDMPEPGPWRIIVSPASSETSQQPQLALHDLRQITLTKSRIWLLRQQQVYEGDGSQPAAVTVHAIDGVPYAYRFSTTEYEVEPAMRIATNVRRVRAAAGQRRQVYRCRILEPDGRTTSPIEFRALFTWKDGSWGRMFAGEGTLSRRAGAARDGVTMAVVLRDGESFHYPLATLPLDRDGILHVVRGRGTPPARRVAGGVLQQFTEPEFAFVENGNFRSIDRLDIYNPASDYREIGVWRDGDDVVVTCNRMPLMGTVVAYDRAGRFAIERNSRMVALERVELQPIDFGDLLARYAEANLASGMMVSHQVLLDAIADDDEPWMTIQTWRLFRDNRGEFRLARDADPANTVALPTEQRVFAPAHSRSRVRIRVFDESASITLPLHAR